MFQLPGSTFLKSGNYLYCLVFVVHFSSMSSAVKSVLNNLFNDIYLCCCLTVKNTSYEVFSTVLRNL